MTGGDAAIPAVDSTTSLRRVMREQDRRETATATVDQRQLHGVLRASEETPCEQRGIGALQPVMRNRVAII